MLSCAALSSKFAIVLLKRASQLSSISSKQLNEKKEKEYENIHPRTNSADDQSETELCQTWACRQKGCVLCVILSSPDPTLLVLSSSIAYELYSMVHLCDYRETTIACAIFQCSDYTFILTTPTYIQ